MVGDAVLLDERDEVGGRVAAERRAGEMPVVRQESVGSGAECW